MLGANTVRVRSGSRILQGLIKRICMLLIEIYFNFGGLEEPRIQRIHNVGVCLLSCGGGFLWLAGLLFLDYVSEYGGTQCPGVWIWFLQEVYGLGLVLAVLLRTRG